MSELWILAYQAAVFSFAATMSPGPNNIMLLASGANYGYKRTLPHILGVNHGYVFLIFICGLGLGAVFQKFPLLQAVLRVLGSGYLLYLAWRVLQAASPKAAKGAKPFSYVEAFMFQFVNPKSWVLAITIAASFTDSHSAYSIWWQLAAMFSMILPICFFVSSSWTIFGVAIANFLQNDRNRRIFNISMAGLLVLSVYWIIN